MNLWPGRWILALATGLAVGGCASDDAHRYDAAAGWRAARVLQVGDDLAAPRSTGDDCRRAAVPAERRPRYAEVWFVEMRRLRRRIALLPDDGAFDVDDKVYVNLLDCGTPLAHAGSVRPSGDRD